jgi:hypothetical protein
MSDALSELDNALQKVFKVRPLPRSIQKIKTALDNYKKEAQRSSFFHLKIAVVQALPYLVKNIELSLIKKTMNELGEHHQFPPEDWHVHLPKSSHRFFEDVVPPQAPTDYVALLTNPIEAPTKVQSDHDRVASLFIENIHRHGFSILSDMVKEHPEFLPELTNSSKEICKKLTKTECILYLTHPEIAQLILKHYQPELEQIATINDNSERFQAIEQFVHSINNDFLSNGLDVNRLLNHSEAKAILETSSVFRDYQSGYHTEPRFSPR